MCGLEKKLGGCSVTPLDCHNIHPKELFFAVVETFNKFQHLTWIFNVGCKFFPPITFSLFNCVFIIPPQGNISIFTLGGLDFVIFP